MLHDNLIIPGVQHRRRLAGIVNNLNYRYIQLILINYEDLSCISIFNLIFRIQGRSRKNGKGDHRNRVAYSQNHGKDYEEGEKADTGEVKKPHLEEATNGSNGTAATTASNGTNGH